MKALCPSYLERQNVTFFVQISNEYLIQALLTLGEKHDLPFLTDVAYKGIRQNNRYASPLKIVTLMKSLLFKITSAPG